MRKQIEEIKIKQEISFFEKQKRRKLNKNEIFAIRKLHKKGELYKKFIKNVRGFYYDIAEYVSLEYNLNLQLNKVYIESYYKPFLIAILQNIYKETKRIFGGKLRKEMKDKLSIKKELSETDIFSEIEDEYESKMRLQFFNMAKKQSNFILDTIYKDIEAHEIIAQEKYKKEFSILQAYITGLGLEMLLTSNNKETEKLQKKKDFYTNQLSLLEKKKDKTIQQYLEDGLKERFDSRAKTTTMQEVGESEAVAQDMEASILSENALLIGGLIASNMNTNEEEVQNVGFDIIKIWVSILDEKTREWHAQADGQKVPKEQPFNVGGEALMFPRDPNGSPSNIINCRCEAEYEFIIKQ